MGRQKKGSEPTHGNTSNKKPASPRADNNQSEEPEDDTSDGDGRPTTRWFGGSSAGIPGGGV